MTIALDRADLESGGYLERGAPALTPGALLFKICDAIPRDLLFSDDAHLKASYGLAGSATRVLDLYEWEHPTVAIYESNVKPSESVDLQAIAKALCEGGRRWIAGYTPRAEIPSPIADADANNATGIDEACAVTLPDSVRNSNRTNPRMVVIARRTDALLRF